MALKDQEIQEIVSFAQERGIHPSSLLAVCEVESGGRLFARVSGQDEPLIRFEGHYFYRLLAASRRNRAVVQGLAHRKAGRVANPRTQAGRWKLLHKASVIDRDAALQSVSWGLGQVMGIHWRWLEYGSIDAMVAAARSGLDGQVELMVRFIEKSGLTDALAEADWRDFARGYNGPAYARNRYDGKLAAASRKYALLLGEAAPNHKANRNAPLVLKFGDHGEMVRELQVELRSAGFQLVADGDFGSATLIAVRQFQEVRGIEVDGQVGPETFKELSRRQ
jgi:hypothetical protein